MKKWIAVLIVSWSSQVFASEGQLMSFQFSRNGEIVCGIWLSVTENKVPSNWCDVPMGLNHLRIGVSISPNSDQSFLIVAQPVEISPKGEVENFGDLRITTVVGESAKISQHDGEGRELLSFAVTFY